MAEKEKRLNVKLTEQEHEAIMKWAKGKNLNLSSYIRNHLLKMAEENK